MAIRLSLEDHEALEALLGSVFDAHAEGSIGRDDAVSVLAHLVAAAAIDNGEELRRWFCPDAVERWRSSEGGA